MSESERELLRRWVDGWKIAAPLMEQFRSDDLVAMTDTQAARQFVALTSGPPVNDAPDEGLVEQQRISLKVASWKN